MHIIFAFASAFIFFLSPQSAFAQLSAAQGIVNFIASQSGLSSAIPVPSVYCGAVTGGIGACQLAALFVYAVHQARFIVGAIAFLVISVSGFRLIISQSEEALATARRSILGAVVGLFLFFVSEPFVDSIYGGFTISPGEVLDSPGNAQAAAIILSVEMFGILRWVETLVAIVATTLLIIQAVYVLGSFGGEETIRKAYRAVLYTGMGLLLIVLDRVIASIFGFSTIGNPPSTPNAIIFIVEVFGFMRFFLFFIGMIIVGVVIYSGLLMLFNYGNDEAITRAKTSLINAALGLLLIVVSFVIVSTIILGIT